jgi:hypothetical protein
VVHSVAPLDVYTIGNSSQAIPGVTIGTMDVGSTIVDILPERDTQGNTSPVYAISGFIWTIPVLDVPDELSVILPDRVIVLSIGVFIESPDAVICMVLSGTLLFSAYQRNPRIPVRDTSHIAHM